MKGCPLCKVYKEKILAQNKDFIIVRTKTMKKHLERIMIVLRVHAPQMLSSMERDGEKFLEETGKKLFSYTSFFIIMDPTFATIKDHWHLVASDLDKDSDDYQQIWETKWRKIVSVHDNIT